MLQVSFICVVVLDGGKTMVVLATRTRKELCGHGIMKRVSVHAMEENYKVNPNLMYYAGVADKTVYYDLVHPSVKRGLQKLVQKKVNRALSGCCFHIMSYKTHTDPLCKNNVLMTC